MWTAPRLGRPFGRVLRARGWALGGDHLRHRLDVLGEAARRHVVQQPLAQKILLGVVEAGPEERHPADGLKLLGAVLARFRSRIDYSQRFTCLSCKNQFASILDTGGFMWRLAGKFVFIAVLHCVGGGVAAAPVTYSFSTSASPFGTTSIAGLFSSDAVISGTFDFDSAAPFIQDVGTGLSYGGHNATTGNAASFSELSGSVSGLSFSDKRGVVIVGNDRSPAPGAVPVDSLALSADPSLTSTSPRNLVGFTIGDYTLVNVRLFWLEDQSVPDLITDFLDNEALPATLPTFDGRMALDFVRTGTTTTSLAGSVFFDGLNVDASTPVSEPETLALLLTGLGSMVFCSRRKRLTVIKAHSNVRLSQ
ncbi:PEP-CTERM -sorting domain protein [Hydrogenophaga sp. RAC07]|nr:PEP-CTERM -sorting domain protein [Hydrogenophaga sp. RAC07]